MELINKRYKINKIINEDYYNEAYIVNDLWQNNREMYLTIYLPGKDTNTIDYMIDNFIKLSHIHHGNLLWCGKFDIVETINLKKNDIAMYYLTSEYIEPIVLEDVIHKLDFKTRLIILLDIMKVINHLHFNGINYKILNPFNILIDKNNNVKLRNLASSRNIYIQNLYDDIEAHFMDPKIVIDPDMEAKSGDLYSIGMMMKYLFFEVSLDNLENINYELEDLKYNLDLGQASTLTNIMHDLMVDDGSQKSNKLLIYIKDIIDKFKLNYEYKIIEDRDKIYSKTKIRGREKELKKIIGIDKLLDRGINENGLILISGEKGVGKSRFLKELRFRLGFRGKKICSLNVDGRDYLGLINMNKLFRETVRFASNKILLKYKDDFNYLLYKPEVEKDDQEIDIKEKNMEFRLYNRFSSYLLELSKEDKIYIIIDNIDKASKRCVGLIEYLVSNTESKNIVFILSYTKGNTIKDSVVSKKLNVLLNNNKNYYLELNNISNYDYKRIISDKLGTENINEYIMNYIITRSEGNIKYGINLLKTLHNGSEIYIDERGNWNISLREYNRNNDAIYRDNINLQIEGIDERSLKVFKVMSIFNNILEESLIAEILNLDIREMDEHVQALIQEDIIEKDILGTNAFYIINDNELKDMAYSQLEKDEKKELHKKASDILMRTYLQKSSLYLEELLNHLFRSDQHQLALDIALKFLGEFENKYSDEYIYILELLESVAEIDPRREKLQILDDLVEICILKGHMRKADYYLERLSALSVNGNNTYYIVKSKYFKCKLLFNKNKIEEVKNTIEEMEVLILKNSSIEEKLLLLNMRIVFNLHINNLNMTKEDLTKALELCETLGDKVYLGKFYNLKGRHEYVMGNQDVAFNDFETSINYFNETNYLLGVLKPLNNLGHIFSNNFGDYKKALDYYNTGYDLAYRYGIIRHVAAFLNDIGEIHLSRFQYKLSVKYFNKSLNVLKEIEEPRGNFIASANLGIAYLQTGNNDNALKIHRELKDYILKNNSIDEITLGKYYKFVALLHGSFGYWEEAKRYSENMSKIFKKCDLKKYLNSQFMIIYYSYCLDGYLDKEKVVTLLKSYDDSKLIYDKFNTILTFSLLSAIEGDNHFGVELFLKYKSEGKDCKTPLFEALAKLVKMILYPNEDNIEQMEKTIYSSDEDLNNIKIQVYTILGHVFLESKQYKKAIRGFLESLDLIFKFINFNGNYEFKYKYIESHNGDLIKESLYKTMELEFNKKIEYSRLNELESHELYNYSGFNKIVEGLSNEEFMSIVGAKDKKEDIKSVEDLLSTMGEDYRGNLKSILAYIKSETLADRAFIIIQDIKNGEYIDIISSVEGDKFNKRSGILNLSNRSDRGILLNKTFPNMGDSKYIDYLSNDLVGLICVPISKTRKDTKISNRRKKEEDLNDHYKVHIYLETNSLLSRFDFKRLKLINSISYLVYINIESNRLKVANTTDKLTGVLTRKQFELDLDVLITKHNRTNTCFSLLMLDIDDFKDINDSYGHPKGDESLTLIGKTLNSSVRAGDLVGRYGGEEFIIALVNTNINEGEIVAEKIRSIIEELQIPGINRKITVSIGLAQYPIHSQFKKILINKADHALYESKEKNNKNNVTIWNNDIEKTSSKLDCLEGVLSGASTLEYKNMNSVLKIISLNTQDKPLNDKVNLFLQTLNSCVGAADSSLFILDEEYNYKKTFSKSKKKKSYKYNYNYDLIEKTLKSRSEEILIDWGNNESIDEMSGMPNWQSIIVIPLIIREVVKGIVYLRVPLKEKEFDNSSLNLSKLLSDAFAPNLQQ